MKNLLRTATVLSFLLLLSSCGLLPFFANTFGPNSLANSIQFDVEGATAIAGTNSTPRTLESISTGARAALSRATDADAALVKIMEDGSLESAIDFGANAGWQPAITFLSVGDDGSAYICFSNIFYSGNQALQFVRVYPDPDKPFEILWPLDSATFNWTTDGQVQTWSWWGMDTDPLAKGPDGKLYFLVQKSSGNTSENVVYSYDPSAGGKPKAMTPSGASLQISTFQVDAKSRLFVQNFSGWNGSANFLRYYLPNIATATNIYYSSDQSTWVRGYTTDPLGRFLIINGYGINKKADNSDQGLCGIIKVDFDPYDPSKFTMKTMYPSGVSNYIRLVKYKGDSWDSGSEILVYDGSVTTGRWSWNPDVLDTMDPSKPDPVKVIAKINNLYMEPPTLYNTLPDNASLDTLLLSSYGDLPWDADSCMFLDQYFSGETFTAYLLYNGYAGLNLDNIGSMLWLSDGSLYGLYDSSWWGGMTSSSGTIIKLLDRDGNRSLKILKLEKGDQKPTMIKVIGDKFYYRYSILTDGGYESGNHQLASVDPVTGDQFPLLLPADLPAMEILAYDVTSDNKELYFVGFDPLSNTIQAGKVDLVAETWSRLDTAARLTQIRTIN